MFRAQWAALEALATLPDIESLDAATRQDAEFLQDHVALHELFEAVALPSDMVQLPALEECRELEELARGTWRTGLLPFRSTYVSGKCYC